MLPPWLPGQLFNYAPPWLGPSLLVVGLVLLTAGTFTTSELVYTITPVQWTGILTMGVGLTVVLAPLYVRYPAGVLAVLTVLGRGIEGTAAVRTLQRHLASVRGEDVDSWEAVRRQYRRVGYVLAVVGSGLALVYLVAVSPVDSLVRSLAVVRSFAIVGLTVAAVGWRVRDVRELFSLVFYAGIVLTAVGTEVHNLATLASLALVVLGEVGYVAGIALALRAWQLLAAEEYQQLTELFVLDYYTKQSVRE
jgi:hypothetical protein